MDLAASLLDHDRRAVARALTTVENRDAGHEELLRRIAPHCGRAHRVGLTGPPGVGKSSLASALVRAVRAAGKKIAVLAIDPTSPFTGGALLGDRIRMNEHLGDAGVFVRSMATRGALGGLSAAAGDAMDVLDAGGFDVILVETVGVGQSEVEVAGETETTLLVLAPGAGDGIQAMKTGLMEIADYWVVNKCDDDRAPALQSELVQALTLLPRDDAVEERVLMASALTAQGVSELWNTLEERIAELEASGERERRRHQRLCRRVAQTTRERVEAALEGVVAAKADALAAEVRAGKRSLASVRATLVGEVCAALAPATEESR